MTFKEFVVAKTLVISMSDVVRHPWYQKLANKPDGLKALLYSMGLDVSKGYTVWAGEHRSEMTKQIVNCERFSGTERTDKNWLGIVDQIKSL